jgi:hypothetical protein
VKISHTTNRRSSAPRAPDDTAHRGTATLGCALTFSNDATTIILAALSDFAKGRRRLCLMPGETCSPQAGISRAFSVTSAFLSVLCVRSLSHPSDGRPQNRQFLFNKNGPLPNFATRTKQTTSFLSFAASNRPSLTSNLAIHTKHTTWSQITTFFLFDTNERSPFTTHRSLITNATGAFKDFHFRPARRSIVPETFARKFTPSGKRNA